ncbi:hypothetical protein [Rhodococcus sp. BE178]|uniref:hypothetical protein n=1 Tax=Rhodococcus sp. BE178 TaxID=2817737 RepID=UPI003D23C2BB
MNQQDEQAREELVAWLWAADLPVWNFHTPEGGCDARRATAMEAAEKAADEVMASFDHLAGVLGYSRPRVVETTEELASMPDGTAIHNNAGNLGELDTINGVRVIFWAGSECESELHGPWIGLPATVLRLPEESR